MNKSEAIDRVGAITNAFVSDMLRVRQELFDKIEQLEKDCDEFLTPEEQTQVATYSAVEMARRSKELE